MEEKNPAVINMEEVEEVFEKDFQESQREPTHRKPSDELLKTLSTSVWYEGKRRAETAFKSYTNIDLLRPYFDVEPGEVFRRLIRSFIPVLPKACSSETLPSELYGPVMLCFTLVALLLYQMKASGHYVQEGTLMGSALITCFGYWMGVSGLLWVVAYLTNTRLRPVQISTLLGYGLTGHCIVVMLSTIVHTAHTHIFFYLIWILFGGLCGLRIIFVFVARTPGHSERVVLALVIGVLHMMFLLYLHFAYHEIVQGLSDALSEGDKLRPIYKGVASRQ